ncbi:MAG: type II secretion system protein [Verrucomicrobiota bacterium]
MLSLNHTAGFTLLEVMLAVMIFAIAVVGLLTALSTTIGSAAAFNREAQVRMALQTRLAEARVIDFAEGATTSDPDEMGVIYTTEITPLELQNGEGRPLDHLYSLRITANWTQGGEEEAQTAEVYVYH